MHFATKQNRQFTNNIVSKQGTSTLAEAGGVYIINHFSRGWWRVNYQPLQSRLVPCKLSATSVDAGGM